MATNVQNVAAGKPKIGGAVSVAPLGTTLPTTADESLDAAFKSLGYINEDGLTNALNMKTDVIKAWGGDVVLTPNNGKEDTFKFSLIEVLNEDVLKFVYGSDNVSGSLSTGISISVNNKDLPDVIVVADMIMRGSVKRIVLPTAHVTEVGEITYADSEAVAYETTVLAKPDANGNSHYEYIKTASAGSGSGS